MTDSALPAPSNGENVTATLRGLVTEALFDIGVEGSYDPDDPNDDVAGKAAHDECCYLADELIERLGIEQVGWKQVGASFLLSPNEPRASAVEWEPVYRLGAATDGRCQECGDPSPIGRPFCAACEQRGAD